MSRICIFCEIWASGGIESFIKNVLINMDLSDLEVEIIASELRDSIFKEDLSAIGVSFSELSGNRYNITKNRRMLRNLLSMKAFDVIHINAYQAATLCYAKIAKEAGIKNIILHSHNNALKEGRLQGAKLRIHNICRKRYTEWGTDFWACSGEAAAFMFDRTTLKSRGYCFIPNAISTDRFHFKEKERDDVRQTLGVDENFVIGNVGRLCRQKNQSFLLDVFYIVKNCCPKSKLLLVGDGEDRKKLESKARSLGIENDVIFYGVSKSVDKLLFAMDVFVFPSMFEAFGIALIEAQATGLRTLCSECPPREAIVTDLVERLPLAISAEAWADSLLKLLDMEPPQRDLYDTVIKRNGFGIKSVSETIKDRYQGKSSKGVLFFDESRT